MSNDTNQNFIIDGLIEIVDSLLYFIDEDGVCENGCSCGECDNCLEFIDILSTFNSIKKGLQKNNI